MTDLVCEYEPWKGGIVHKGMKVNSKANNINILQWLIYMCICSPPLLGSFVMWRLN